MSAKALPFGPRLPRSLDVDTDGNFTDATDALPSLFADPDGRGARRWSQMFDKARCEPIDFESLLSGVPKI